MPTRVPLVLLTLLAANQSAGSTQGIPPTQPTRVDAEFLSWALNHGTVTVLDTVPGGEHQWFTLRLWRLPVLGSCNGGTDAACESQYLLGVVSGDGSEAGEDEGVYDLGSFGGLRVVEWAPWDTVAYFRAQLLVEVDHYTPPSKSDEAAHLQSVRCWLNLSLNGRRRLMAPTFECR